MRHPIASYSDFSAGANLDASPNALRDNELREAVNVDFSYLGAAQKRKGSAKLNSTSYAATVNSTIEWPRNDGTKTLLAVMTAGDPAVSKLYSINDTTGAATEICTLAKADIGYFFWQDRFYFVDGEKYRMYDGTDVLSASSATPSTPSVSIYTGSVPPEPVIPPGTYKGLVTFVHTDGTEFPSNPWTRSTSNTCRFILENIPVPAAGSGITSRKLYRTHDGGSTYYLVATLDLEETTYSDNKLDSELTIEYKPVWGNITPIERCNRCAYHPQSSRFFMSGDTSNPAAVYFSEPGAPSQFLEDSILYPSSGDGSVIGLEIFTNALLAFYGGATWAWTGIDPTTDVTWYRLPVSYGPLSRSNIEHVPNALSFVGNGGVYVISPAALMGNVVLQPGESLVANLAQNRFVSLLNGASSLASSCAVFDQIRQRYILAYQEDSASAGNDRLLVMEWGGKMPFSVWTGINANHLCLRANGDVLASCENYIVKLNQDVYTDVDTTDGSTRNIAMSLKTKPYPLGNPIADKKTFSVFVTTEAVTGATLDLTVTGDDGDHKWPGVRADGNTKELRCLTRGKSVTVDVASEEPYALRLTGLAFEYKLLPPRRGD